MNKSGKIFITVLAIVIAGILLSIPVGLLMSQESKASTEEGTVNVNETYTDDAGDDYIFVVLEDEKVPLAAMPESNSISTYLILSVVITLCCIASLVYVSWYLSIRRNIKKCSLLVSGKELREILPSNSFLHPIALSSAEREVQSVAAYRFL